MRIIKIILISCFVLPLLAQSDENQAAKVAEVFSSALKNLTKVKNYRADFSVNIKSMKGDVNQKGSFWHVLPYKFRCDEKTVAMGGIMNVDELTVCNGKTGWEVMKAPNGNVVNASRWGLASMSEMFYAFFNKAQFPKVASDTSNTYFIITHDNTFESVTQQGKDSILTGKMRVSSQRYSEIKRVAMTMGASGISNYLPHKVVMRINKNGIPIKFEQYNLLGQKIVSAELKNLKVNTKIDPKIFDYSVPKGVEILDIDSALVQEPIHVTHPFLNKKTGQLDLIYLSGKEAKLVIGKTPMVITFFASRSKNSCAFLPKLEALYSKYTKKGVKFVTITDAEDYTSLLEYRKKSRMTMPFYLDKDSLTIPRYAIKVVPKVFVVNKAGTVIDVLEGNPAGIENELEASIKRTLK